ncbi:hypothetical protein LTR36_005754 [Oleoguttula mirabilis]|uniref:Uncharacterized protein n=1 Tax=Oleoguttula mirabilis TaxID=1507867 RepID=A0AAV9JEK2_9PEZI|nr:hypothetical protein LTR36_005754 [Oleoguttula mirabilis]
MFTKTLVFALAAGSFLGLTTAHPHVHPATALSIGATTITSAPAGVNKRDDDGEVCMSEGVAYPCDLATGGGIATFPGLAIPTPLAGLIPGIDQRDDTTTPSSDSASAPAGLDARAAAQHTVTYCNRLTPQSCTALPVHANDDCYDLGAPGFQIFHFGAGLTCTVYKASDCTTPDAGFSNKHSVGGLTAYFDAKDDPKAIAKGVGLVASFRCH